MHPHIDPNLLAVLAILIETRSVSATARRLGISQPTVSRWLAQLRAKLDDPILVRTTAGMVRTRRAEELAAPLERWLVETGTLLTPATFSPATLDRCFRLASTDYGVLAVIAPALPAIGMAAPGLVIDVVPLDEDMLPKLVSGAIDLAITGLPTCRSLVYDRALFVEHFTCVMRADHPLAGNGPIALEDYLRWPHVGIKIGEREVDHVDVRLGADVARRRVLVRLPYFYAAPDLIAASDMVMTLPTRAAIRLAQGASLHHQPAPAEIEGFTYSLLWHEHNMRDPATMWLSDMLAAACLHSSEA